MCGGVNSLGPDRERERASYMHTVIDFFFFLHFLPGPVARTNLPRTTFTLEPNHDRVSCYFILRPFCCPLFHSLKVGRRHKTTQATHNDNLLSLAAKTTLRHVVGRNPPPLTRKMKLQLKKNIKKLFLCLCGGPYACFSGPCSFLISYFRLVLLSLPRKKIYPNLFLVGRMRKKTFSTCHVFDY